MSGILNPDGLPARSIEELDKVVEEADKEATKKTKIPKEIEKLCNAFDNRKQHYFMMYVQDERFITVSNINPKDKQQGIEVLQQSIKNHYENL